MSACYFVCLKVRVTDEAKAVKALQQRIILESRDTRFHLEDYQARGVGIDLFPDLMRIFLADWGDETQYEEKACEDGMTEYSNSFNACYGWELIMRDMFSDIAPFVSENSFMDVYPDNGSYRLIVRNGKMAETKIPK